MDRIWQWAWDRYGARYPWAVWLITFAEMLSAYLVWSSVIVALEKSSRYVEATAATAVAVAVMALVVMLPGNQVFRIAQRWAAGLEVDRAGALDATYTWARAALARSLGFMPASAALLLIVVGAIAGASGVTLVQYGILGAATGFAATLVTTHAFFEAAVRPIRAALAGDQPIGDGLPRARPTFATWLNLSTLGSLFWFAAMGVGLGIVLDRSGDVPPAVLAVAIATTLALILGVPITVGTVVAPSLRPIRDLAAGTERVAAGDYTQRLPVVQDDDLGALSASFNRMQAGLAERQRLRAAFGTYVDPALAARLLEQGDDVFTGERREVTVMFVDVRDFTPFAEANTAEDTVARLNALFEIVVPAVVDAGGHVNKFLGDGALAVFGAPHDLANHADAAVNAGVLIQRLVAEQFGGDLRVGIGINTGVVIAGTIGGGSHLEFTLIGDTTNVAARVEQLTKTTGDVILLTEQTVDALASRPSGLADRGSHALKGKSTAVQVFGLDPKGRVSI
ncbi:family 3 adenylate cyclase [Mycobacterium sp. JS623]|uniref:adenylate/guanylate cyclase domain-containing protein n=1 Tax=Mycobacterium sp. JS623 TaxID=212767 RepID=UPI0002A578C7|nr:adenylate/guanylate cyclase domain-containing protein [Mycobacterium sp. JS623]AGB25440.1 family 3 adenylate cyclase [Mycobacterium sp. JS623]